MVQDQNEVRALLEWADQKAVSVPEKFGYKPSALRIWLARALAFALALDRALDYVLDYALALDLTFNRALALDLDLALDRALALDLALDRALALDLDRALDHALALARDLKLKTIEQKLSELSKPAKHVSKEDWSVLRNALSAIRTEFRDLSGLNYLELSEEDNKLPWSKEASEIFDTYYKANKLLVDCLNLAMVTNRDAILNQLFLPASEQ